MIVFLFFVLLAARQLIHWRLTRHCSLLRTSSEHWTVAALFFSYLGGICAVLWTALSGHFPALSASLALGLFGAAIAWRAAALRALGESFHYGLAPPPALVRHGPYRRVRHPLHLGLLAEFAAMAWLSGNFFGLLSFLVTFALILRRNQLEDRYLLRQLGEAYRKYRDQIPALLPRLPHQRRRPRALDME